MKGVFIMNNITNRKELLAFWKTEGSPFMWEDIKKLSRGSDIITIDDLRAKLEKLKIKRERK